MMKKILAVSCFAFALCIPLIAKSQQQNQFPSLDTLNREQLIQVINCMALTPGKTVAQCIDQILDPQSNLMVTILPTVAKSQTVVSTSSMPVYVLNVLAGNNPVAVQTIDLTMKLEDIASKQIEHPATLINGISVFVDGIRVTTLPVNASTFTVNTNNEYVLRLAQLGINIPAKSQKRITFEVTTFNRTADKRITIASPLNSIRVVDSVTNINYFPSITGLIEGQSTVFKANVSAPVAVLRASVSPFPVVTKNNYIRPTSQVTTVDVMKFDVGSGANSSIIQSIGVSATGTIPNTMYLFDGNTLLASVPGASRVIFNNLNRTIGNSTTTLTVKADFAPFSPNGSQQGFSMVAVNEIKYLPGTNASLSPVTLSTDILGRIQYLSGRNVANFTLVNPPRLVASTGPDGKTTVVQAEFNLNVSSNGGSLPQFKTDQFGIVLRKTTGNENAIDVATSSIVVTHNPNSPIADGSTASVTVQATIMARNIPTSGNYVAAINNITWNNTSGTVNQYWGLENLISPNFVTVVK